MRGTKIENNFHDFFCKPLTQKSSTLTIISKRIFSEPQHLIMQEYHKYDITENLKCFNSNFSFRLQLFPDSSNLKNER